MKGLLIAAAGLLAVLVVIQSWRALDVNPAPSPPPRTLSTSRAKGTPSHPTPIASLPSHDWKYGDPIVRGPIRGRVIDQQGRGVGGVGVCVTGTEGGGGYYYPSNIGSLRTPEGILTGSVFRSHHDGRFELELRDPGEYWVGLLKEPGYTPAASLVQKVRAPKSEFLIKVQTWAYATINLRVRSGSDRFYKSFRCTYAVDGKEQGSVRARGRHCSLTPRIPEGHESAVVTCSISGMDVGTSRAESIRVQVGETISFDYWVSEPVYSRGVVRDAGGQPVPGARVWFGVPALLHDSSGRPRSIAELRGVLTDAAGRFELLGDRPCISAWKPGRSPASVRRAPEVELTLPVAGKIQGEREDPGTRVTLDGDRTVTVGADGAFGFAGVRAGWHHLRFGDADDRWAEVRSGETTKVIPPTDEVVVPLQFDGVPDLVVAGDMVTLVGRGGARQLKRLEVSEHVILRGLEAGDYWLCHEKGWAMPTTLHEGEVSQVRIPSFFLVKFDLRSAVEGPPGARYAIVRDDLEPALYPLMRHLLARRLPPGGFVRVSDVAEGEGFVLHEFGVTRLRRAASWFWQRHALIPR